MDWKQDPLEPVADRLAKVFAGINTGLADACELIADADIGQEFLADGSPHMVQWLTARFGIEAEFGRRLVTLAHRLESLPELRHRFSSGRFTLAAVEILAEVATPDTETELADEAEALDLPAIERMARRSDPPSSDDAVTAFRSRWLSTQWDLHHGEMSIAGKLTGAEAALVEDRLHAAAEHTPPNPETGTYDPWDARMADGLVEICATSGDMAGPPPQLSVHADLHALTADSGVSELAQGPVIANETSRRLACDAVVETVVHNADSLVVGVGRNQRTVPGWLRRLLEHRDHHCRFPGCDHTRWTHAHHIQHWADGGPTNLDNLVLLCGFHHRYLHEHGWHITGHPSQQITFRKPDWTPHPPPPSESEPRIRTLVGAGHS